MIAMTKLNQNAEFVDDSPPSTVRIRTDDEKREAALRLLVDMGAVRICDVCGKPFRTSDPYRRNAKRCSWKCSQDAKRRSARERNRKMRAGDK